MLTAYHQSLKVLRLIWHTIERFESMERRRDAAALTYTTLFALVPVITVTYSILSGVPALQAWGQQAHTNLLGYVMPEGSELVSQYLVRFSEQAQQLTWLGVLFLFATALLLLQTIEQQFNRIWRVEVARSPVQRFFRYWAVLSLGPMLFAAAQAASSLLTSLNILQAGGADLPRIAMMVPWLLTTVAMTFVYMMVPNCKVPGKDALVAALVVATVFETGKFLFARIVGMFPSYQLIYGAFAAVPLFLMWVYLSWLVVLFGAELTYSLSHPHGKTAFDPVRQRVKLLSVMLARQRNGHVFEESSGKHSLEGMPAPQVSALLQQFRQRGWVQQTQDESWIWVPDLRHINAREFFSDLTLADMELAGAAAPTDDAVARWWKAWNQSPASALNQTLENILNTQEPLQPSGQSLS